MKRKVILILLAMCYIIASIPASGAETAECPPHSDFINLCGGFAGWEDASHTYVNAAGNIVTCPAKDIMFYTATYCGKCYDEMNNSMNRTHKHGEEGHVCDETKNNNDCPLNY